MFGLKNRTLLWKNAGQIIALLIIATQIFCVVSVTDNMKKNRGKRNAWTHPTPYQVSPVNNLITCDTPLCSIKKNAENKYIKNNSNKSDTYTVLNEKHKKELDDVRKSDDEIRSYSQKVDYQTEVTRNIQTQLDECLQVMTKYEKQSEELLNTRISLCAAHISLEKFEKASEVLSLFNYHDDMLARVMEYTYNTYNPDDIDKILQFLFEDFKCDEKTYTILFENMKKNNQLHDLIVLRFYLEIDKCKLENLKKKVFPYCDWVIKTLIAKIRSSDDKKLLDFMSKRPRNSETIIFYIYGIVDKVYDNNLRNYKNTMTFLNKLSSLPTKINGYLALLHQMTINNHLHNEEIFEFAFLVKDMEKSHQLRDDSIRSKIPVVIRKIVWEEDCTIKNIGKNEYLYAPNNNYLLEMEHQLIRRIFTWIPGNPINNGYWKFRPTLSSSTSFFIENTFWNDYNFLTIVHSSMVEFFSPDDFMLVAGRFEGKETFFWKLEPRTISNRNVFILKNRSSKYLPLRVTTNHDSDRRNNQLRGYDDSWDFYWEIE